jgi:hypothetical protein
MLVQLRYPEVGDHAQKTLSSFLADNEEQVARGAALPKLQRR